MGGERLLDKMKASICLLFCLYVPYVLSAAAGNDEGRKKRSADGNSNDYSTYYGAGPSAQYQTFGFGMAGQQPFHGKMRYGDSSVRREIQGLASWSSYVWIQNEANGSLPQQKSWALAILVAERYVQSVPGSENT